MSIPSVIVTIMFAFFFRFNQVLVGNGKDTNTNSHLYQLCGVLKFISSNVVFKESVNFF